MKYSKYEGQALRNIPNVMKVLFGNILSVKVGHLGNIPNEVEGHGLMKYCKILYFKTKCIG